MQILSRANYTSRYVFGDTALYFKSDSDRHCYQSSKAELASRVTRTLQ
jgi:hypothetical protein